MYFVNVIKSIEYKNRYIGNTSDVNKRLIEHNKGKCRYTKGRRPWLLIYKEHLKTRSEATKRERFLKTGQGRKFLDSIIK